MRFAIAALGLTLGLPAVGQTPVVPPKLPDMPPVFRFDGDRMQLAPLPGFPADGPQVFRFDDKTLRLVPLPRDADAPRQAPKGELCLLAIDRCPSDAAAYREPYKPGTAHLYALNEAG